MNGGGGGSVKVAPVRGSRQAGSPPFFHEYERDKAVEGFPRRCVVCLGSPISVYHFVRRCDVTRMVRRHSCLKCGRVLGGRAYKYCSECWTAHRREATLESVRRFRERRKAAGSLG